MIGLNEIFLLISSVSTPAAPGSIEVFTFDTATAITTSLGTTQAVRNPSFFTLDQAGRTLYAVGEENEGGTVTAFHANLATGQLHPFSTQPVHGGAPCNITFTPDRAAVVTSNYTGGSITHLSLADDGSLLSAQVTPFTTHGLDPERQGQAHLHAVTFTPDGGLMVADDLGGDCLHLYDVATHSWLPDLPVGPGSGPRHLVWRNDTTAYLIGEISDEVYTLRRSLPKGPLASAGPEPLRIVQRLTAAEVVATGGADIHLSPDGRHLYASHRLDHDGVSIFSVAADGLLTRIGFQPTGRHPRNFALSPDGRYVLVACRDDRRVEIYERDTATGLLTDTGRRIEATAPVCVQFCDAR